MPGIGQADSLMYVLICNEMYVDIMRQKSLDTKGAIRIRISKKNRQHNGQKKKVQNKWTNNDLQIIHIKLKME